MIELEEAAMAVSPMPHRVVVDEVLQLGPHLRRIVFEGETLASLAVSLPAQWLKVGVPDVSGSGLVQRAYTIRGAYRGWGVVVVDFVLHADAGPVAAWARRAVVGDVAYLGGADGGYQLDPAADWYLLAGDETALPAIASILEFLPEDGRPTCVVIEVPTVDDIQALGYPDGTEVHWLARDREPAPEGRLRETLAGLCLPVGTGQIFLAGEMTLVSAIRQDLAGAVLSARVDAAAYWTREPASRSSSGQTGQPVLQYV